MYAINLFIAFTVSCAVEYALGHTLCAPGVRLALAPMLGAALIMGGASVGSSLINKFAGGESQDQIPLETPEQAAARRALLGFAASGKWGNFTAGESMPLGYGDYRMTDPEQVGMTSLQKLLQGGIPEQYAMGDAALKDMLATNPEQIQAQFSPFKDQVQRQVAESNRALTRNAGFAGNLYSTDTIRGLGDVQARGNETMTAELARLTNEALNRRMQAIPLAYQSAAAQQDAALQQIQASQQFGSLTRNLNDASIKARDAELLRRRQELQLPIQALGTVAGSQSTFGVPSVQTSGNSPYAEILKTVGQMGGMYYLTQGMGGDVNTRKGPILNAGEYK